jgi:hypothetical protein
VPSTGPVWEIAYAHWQDTRWAGIMLDRRPYGDFGHSAIRWTTLTNGIPLESEVAGGPSGSPGVTPEATATPSPAATVAQAPPITGFGVKLRSPLASVIPIAITWDAPTVAGAAVELERKVDSGDWSRLDVPAGGRSASDSLRPGHVHVYRIQTVVAGFPGPWSTLGDVSVARLEASQQGVELRGTWERVSFGDYSGGSAFSTDDRGATLTWRGTTRGFAIVGPIGPTRGRMIITIDGVRADVVDLHANRYQARNVLFATSWADAAVHEIRIEAQPVSGRRTVAVDDIVTLTSALSVLPGS